ncbi:protein adenylyltransferase SelO-like [Echinops telfairi]|uniref:Selenoprotein O n=1 Tax=Echinops telfairi TaxID=9371 RepID=A0ABM0ZTM2_ECHTE|nr:protein adenylyltransferase SelO-like [Echinops telfairi]
MSQSTGFPLCCLIRRLRFLCLLILGVTEHAIPGRLLQPVLAGSASFIHLSHNKSNRDQGSCEKKATLASTLDFWTLATENMIAELPADPVKENYVCKVNSCVFSVAFPTPFKSRVRLVAVSKFGKWADQLGDGGAHLIGIYLNRQGEKWELQLKGSGKTPYSRNGDGRAVLRSSGRELLCSEALHYLGIPPSRAASLVVSDDDVWRDPLYDGNIVKERGAVVLRIAKSWFRIGSLEILAHYGELDLLRTLLDFIIQEHFPSVDVKEPDRELFKAKLGVLGEREEEDDLIAFLLHLMGKTEADFTMTFRQLSEITQSRLLDLNFPQHFWALKKISKHELFPAWLSQYLLRLKRNTNDSDSQRRKRMTSVNPRYVRRNWMAESAVQKAERTDFSEIRFLQQVLQRPFQKQVAAKRAGCSSPPPAWAKELRVSCST